MAPFDRSYKKLTTSYWSAIVSVAVSCAIFELFDVEKYSDLEIRVRCHSKSLKIAPFGSFDISSYSHSIATMAMVVRWLSGRASDLRSSSRGFEIRPRRCCVTTLGKLFTPYCLCHQAV